MIVVNNQEIKSWNFPGGEVGVNALRCEDIIPGTIEVTAYLSSSDEVMKLLMIKDILDRQYIQKGMPMYLTLPYVPYMQQDRVCNEGESLSIKVFADLVNSMNFDHVLTIDCHSDVAPALINNCLNYELHDLFKLNSFKNIRHHIENRGDIIVSPDSGSNKKIQKLIQSLDIKQSFIRADKIRDTSNGEIISTRIYADNDQIKDRSFIIIDDICVGGATFIPLARLLKSKGARSVSLYVTHGVFSKGVDHLLEDIDWIYCTNSRIIPNEIKNHKNVTVLGVCGGTYEI